MGIVPLYPVLRGPDGHPRVPSREEWPIMAPGTAPGVVRTGVRVRLGLELIARPAAIKSGGCRSQQGAIVYVRGVGVTEKGPRMLLFWPLNSHGD